MNALAACSASMGWVVSLTTGDSSCPKSFQGNPFQFIFTAGAVGRADQNPLRPLLGAGTQSANFGAASTAALTVG